MTEEAQMVLDMAKESMAETLSHTKKAFKKIRAGKANSSMIEGVKIDNYGATMPLNQVASISTPDARTITIKPWDKNNLEKIETAIINSNLGFNPQNNGEIIIINVPVLTEERRKQLVQNVYSEAEDSRVSVRNARRAANDEAKNLEKEGMSEDDRKRLESNIQDLTDEYIKKIEELVAEKEKDITTV